MSNKRYSYPLGFTLVELMVTMAVAAILTVLAAPGMLNLIRDARLSSQSDLLVRTLSTARLEAIKQRANMTVCPATNANSDNACAANASDWSTGILVSDGTAIIQRVQMKEGLTIVTAATSVVFSGTLGSSTATSFTLCVSGRSQHQVDVTASGYVSKRINTATICS